MNKMPIAVLVMVSVSGLTAAQSVQRFRATMNGRPGDQGKCTLEVVVDGSVEIEIRGDQASMRNLSGNQPQWRRFVCNGVMPRNPTNFRFAGVDGRGNQQLVGDPRNSGAAVVRIDDPQSGSEGYTFDIFWGGGQGYPGGPGGGGGFPGPGGPGGGGGFPGGNRFTREQAIRACQDNVAGQARDRFRGGDVSFRRINIDDQPGRNDWVVGVLNVRLRNNREEAYRFSCSVNFDNGRLRSATIEDRRTDDRPYNGGR